MLVDIHPDVEVPDVKGSCLAVHHLHVVEDDLGVAHTGDVGLAARSVLQEHLPLTVSGANRINPSFGYKLYSVLKYKLYYFLWY